MPLGAFKASVLGAAGSGGGTPEWELLSSNSTTASTTVDFDISGYKSTYAAFMVFFHGNVTSGSQVAVNIAPYNSADSSSKSTTGAGMGFQNGTSFPTLGNPWSGDGCQLYTAYNFSQGFHCQIWSVETPTSASDAHINGSMFMRGKWGNGTPEYVRQNFGAIDYSSISAGTFDTLRFTTGNGSGYDGRWSFYGMKNSDVTAF